MRIGEAPDGRGPAQPCAFGFTRSGRRSGRSSPRRFDRLFGRELEPPRYVEERGEITMGYRERRVTLDLSSAGRGLQQTLLLLAYLYANPGAVLLLDEPDRAPRDPPTNAKSTCCSLDTARESGGQVIAASHSEVLLNEAADKDLVVAFVGKPHRLAKGDRGSQVLKALREIGFEQLLPGGADGVGALPGRVYGSLGVGGRWREGWATTRPSARSSVPSFTTWQSAEGGPTPLPWPQGRHPGSSRPWLCSIRFEAAAPNLHSIDCLVWKRREIENYVCSQATLESYAAAAAEADVPGPLFAGPRGREANDRDARGYRGHRGGNGAAWPGRAMGPRHQGERRFSHSALPRAISGGSVCRKIS